MEEKAKLAELMAEAEFMQQRQMAENRAEQFRVQEKLAKAKSRSEVYEAMERKGSEVDKSEIKKRKKNCARMEKEKKISFGLKKTNYIIVKTGREEEEINETVKAGRIQRTDKCKYLGMTISTDGKLVEHTKELNSICDIINQEICAIGAKHK